MKKIGTLVDGEELLLNKNKNGMISFVTIWIFDLKRRILKTMNL